MAKSEIKIKKLSFLFKEIQQNRAKKYTMKIKFPNSLLHD